jgi:hypothetical protein
MATPSKGVGSEATRIKPGEVRNPYGAKGKAAAQDEADGWTDDGLTMLERMRKVFGQLPGHDRGPPERELRKLLKKDSKGFVSQMVSLERAEAAAKARDQGPAALAGTGSEGAPPAPADEKTDELLALVDRLLADEQQADQLPGGGR